MDYEGIGFSIDEKGQVTGLNLDLIELTSFTLTILSTLHHLERLSLYSTGITDISSLQRLNQLKVMYLFDNKIKQLPETILELGPDIDVYSSEIGALLSNKNAIFLGGNPLEKPPEEIIRPGKEAIR